MNFTQLVIPQFIVDSPWEVYLILHTLHVLIVVAILKLLKSIFKKRDTPQHQSNITLAKGKVEEGEQGASFHGDKKPFLSSPVQPLNKDEEGYVRLG